MTELPQPSAWATTHFGDNWEQLVHALINAGVAAHERSMDAKEGSRLKSNEAYGATYWLALFEEVFKQLRSFPNASDYHPNRARYSLITLDGVLLFPARFGIRSSDVNNLYLNPSKLRADLLLAPNQTGNAIQLPFDLGPEFDIDDDLVPILPDSQIEKTILVAYDCDPHIGLRHVFIGEVLSFDEKNGYVMWVGTPEELPITTVLGQDHLAGLEQNRNINFDDAPLPIIGLQLLDSNSDVTPGNGIR